MRPSVRRLGRQLRQDETPSVPQLRKGAVLNVGSQLVTVQIGADEISIPALDPTYVAGDDVWILRQGPSQWMVVGREADPAGTLPKAKLRSTATQTPASGSPVRFNFNAAGGLTEYDTVVGSQTMADRTNSRIIIRKAGVYRYGYHAHITLGGAANWFVDVFLNNTLFLPPRSLANSSQTGDVSCSDERAFAVGDFIELFITGSGLTFGSASNELGMSLWMSYIP